MPIGTSSGILVLICRRRILVCCHHIPKWWNKRGKPAVAAFEYRLEDNLCQLQDELLSHTYHPGQYVSFTIHPGAHPRPVTEGLPFLGFIVFPTHRWLKRRNGIAFTRRYKQLRSAHRTGEISLDQVTASVQGWVNHTRFGDTWGLRRAVLCG